MTDTAVALARKIRSAQDLQSVVRTMKALAAANVGQYEQSVRALTEYRKTVELGLSLSFRQLARTRAQSGALTRSRASSGCAIVFGSDQGLVGQFNESIADYVDAQLGTERVDATAPPPAFTVFTVGDRVRVHLEDRGLPVRAGFALPASVDAIAGLVGRLQLEIDAVRDPDSNGRVLVFFQRTATDGRVRATHQRLLPLDATWQAELGKLPWPTKRVPETLGRGRETLRTLLAEHVFISLYAACAESLASENTSRLAAMERADRNIDELLETMHASFHGLRHSAIDEELFDVVAGYEALGSAGGRRGPSG